MDDQKRNNLEEQKNTSWYSAMNYVVAGLVFSGITFQLWNLHIILPSIGLVLLLVGFRSLREENKWFKACWVLSWVRVVCNTLLLWTYATIYQETIGQSAAGTGFQVLRLVLTFALLVSMWGGFRAARQKVGQTGGSGAMTAFILWHVAICFLSMAPAVGLVIGFALVAAYIIILFRLYKQCMVLGEAGYTVQPAPVRWPNRRLVGVLALVTGLGIASGYLFFDSYPMDWEEVSVSESAEVEEVKDKLIKLGFPEDVLDDLLPEEILACAEAEEVVVQQEDYPVNDGREVRNGNVFHTEYDVKELRITEIGVKLPAEADSYGNWQQIHHFLWTTDPGFHGTEAIQLWPAYRQDAVCGLTGTIAGRVLYDKNDVTYTAPYYSLGDETYMADNPFFGSETTTDVYAAFSMPGDGKNHRGYLFYEVETRFDCCWINGIFNYAHQKGIQYPVMTAKEYRMKGFWATTGEPFRMVQDSFEFLQEKAPMGEYNQ